jgi:adenosylcobinamide-GDP ribazoletransferase
LLIRSFLVALAFLTILPVRFRKMPTADIVAASRFWFPVVAVLLGAGLGGWSAAVAAMPCSPLLTAFLILLAWLVSTGALHLDGFCDLCDGLLGGHTPEDRLRIMKDPHLGTFGLAGGVLLLLGKLAALNELLLRDREQTPWLLVAAVVLARCLAQCMAALSSYPRPEGTGKALISATRTWEAGPYALCGAVAVMLCSLALTWRFAGLFLVPCVVVLGLTWICRRRLGGVTGDCLGAAIEGSEVTFLLTAALLP